MNQEESAKENDWTKDPRLSGIDAQKMSMLLSMAQSGSNKTQTELLPFLMAASSTSRKNGMQFSPNEMELIVEVLKTGKSPQEIARIDQMMRIIKSMRR